MAQHRASWDLNLCFLYGSPKAPASQPGSPSSATWPALTLKDLDAAMQAYLIPPGFYNLLSPFLGLPWSLRAILHLTPPGLPTHTMLSFEEPPKHSENTAKYCGHHGMHTHTCSLTSIFPGFGDGSDFSIACKHWGAWVLEPLATFLLRCELREGRSLSLVCFLLCLLGQGQTRQIITAVATINSSHTYL